MKIFAVSDVHSFYTIMKNVLDEAGFEEGNPQHRLVVCGDLFDRGDESQQMLDYMMQMPNKVLIKGNHEQLFEEMCKRGYPESHDWHNGTAKSAMDLVPDAEDWYGVCPVAIQKVRPLLDQMVNYYETEHYIFCHGYLPCTRNRGMYELIEDWREASNLEWKEAQWVNGMAAAMDGCDPGKCVVVGHYHTSWGHAIQDKTFNEFGEGADFSPFYYKDKLIAIDACTAYSGKVNVLVLEDNLMEDAKI